MTVVDQATGVVDTVDATQDVAVRIQNLANGVSVAYSSIKGDDIEAKVALYNATSASENIADNLGTEFNLADIVVTVVPMADEATGVIKNQPRVIFIADDGTAYSAISGVLLDDVERVIGMVGEPHTWGAPRPAKVVEQKSNKGRRFFTLRLL